MIELPRATRNQKKHETGSYADPVNLSPSHDSSKPTAAATLPTGMNIPLHVVLISDTIGSMARVLHILSQRPSLTGSGVTLNALVRHADRAGWTQKVVVGVPSDAPSPSVGGLREHYIHPLRFDTPELPFPVPGMSDVMPYQSTRFSTMDDGQLEAYLSGWRRHLSAVLEETKPDVIHSHHLWLMSSILKELASTTPVIAQCHATGFRQMTLCPHLAPRVKRGCERIDRFAVLHLAHADQLATALGVSRDRVHVIGAGFDEELFNAHRRDQEPSKPLRLLFIGKLANAKGLPWLLDAFDELTQGDRVGELELNVAGSGTGEEASALRRRMKSMAPRVVHHGQLDQPELARLMRKCAVCVLPSFFEGLPLVLVEAIACGCRVVATALPGVVEQLSPALGDALELVELPAMAGVDTPVESELPAFKARLRSAMKRALAAPPLGDPMVTRSQALAPFTWRSVFLRVEALWKELLPAGTPHQR